MQDVENQILSQSMPLPNSRKNALLYASAALCLVSLSVVAAFGIAPHSQVEPIPLQEVVQDISLPVTHSIVTAGPELYWRDERVQQGDTVPAVLARLGVDDSPAVAYLLQARNVRSLYQLVPGKTVRAVVSEDGRLHRLSYLNRDGTQLVVERMPNGFVAGEEIPTLETRYSFASGNIESSLFAATDAAGIPESVAMQMADIFSSDVDFHRDLRRGDRFSVVFEVGYKDDDATDAAQVVAAEFVNQGRIHRAVRFRDSDGRTGYYSPDGKNVRKTFLRSPIEFSRMTSGFMRSRFHPLLGKSRAHKGVDYGAPIGTKVRATASGQVVFAGQQGGYGNVIVLRHGAGYSTLYGHLSGFAKQIHNGARIDQGDIIGFVGRSGLTTGPHLHYEFRLNDVQQNPLNLTPPLGPAITSTQKARFEQITKPLTARLDALSHTRLAQMD
jgi:murein DD-endopeptidase MepM/ murein hydrolase activator NlpD